MNSDRSIPVAIEYLEALGVDVGTAVRAVVVTHYHDDHIRGISDVYAAAQSAELVISDSLGTEEFLVLTALSRRFLSTDTTFGTEEHRHLFRTLRDRTSGGRPGAARPHYACASRPVLRVPVAAGRNAVVTALSPSDATLTLARQMIAELVPQLSSPRRRLVSLGENDIAVALHLEVGCVAAILGSDLESTGNPDTGWEAVVRSTTRPTAQAVVLKVPHHGSVTADHAGIWDQLCRPRPTCALTPYRRGGGHLPLPRDVTRLKTHAGGLHASAPVTARRIRRPQAVQKMIKSTAMEIWPVEGRTGQVRVRINYVKPAAPSVALFDGARTL